MTLDLLVAGKLAIDELTFRGKPYPPILGGSAAHVALAASTVGAKVAIVSSIGKDFPQEFLGMLKSKGINLSGVVQREGQSAHFWADFADDGSMTNYALHFGVGNQLSQMHFSRLAEECRAVHLGILPPYLQRRFIRRVKGLKRLVSMTTIFHQAQTLRDRILPQLSLLDIIFLNAEEAIFLTGDEDLNPAVKKLGELVPLVVVTKGSEGCIINQGGKIQHVSSFPVKEVDSTGAGDSFAGAFLASYIQDSDIIQAAKWGNAAGAMNVQEIGCNSLFRATHQELSDLISKSQ